MALAVATIALALTLALGADGAEVVSESRPAMGTLATVTIAGATPEEAAPGIRAAFAVFARVDWSMNEWRPESPLSRLNARAGEGWVALPGDLCEVLRLAKRGSRLTGGLFDPTWAALSDLWRLDRPESIPPDEARLREACALVDHRGLELRKLGGACEGRLLRQGMRVGLGGIAKGWALDAAARSLRALGYRDFLLQAGGDLYAAGLRGGAPWPVGVRDPRGGRLETVATVAVSDRAFSTSGDYEQRLDKDGRRYHHLIDPRTCEPATASRSVSVLARTAVDAEILGKALFLTGGPAALSLARRLDAEAIVVTGDGEVLATPALRGALRGRSPVTEPGSRPRRLEGGRPRRPRAPGNPRTPRPCRAPRGSSRPLPGSSRSRSPRRWLVPGPPGSRPPPLSRHESNGP